MLATQAPRPSMGSHILTQPPLVDGFLDSADESSQDRSTREPSSFSEAVNPSTPEDPPGKAIDDPDNKRLASEKQNVGEAASARSGVPNAGGKYQASK